MDRRSSTLNVLTQLHLANVNEILRAAKLISNMYKFTKNVVDASPKSSVASMT